MTASQTRVNEFLLASTFRRRQGVIGLPPCSKRIQCDHHYEHQMSQDIQIQLFENAKVRYLWDEEKQQYFFSVVDVIQVLTDSSNPQTYWRVLKKRLSDEGNETVTNCNALKMPAPDGKMRLTDVATTSRAAGWQCGACRSRAVGA